METFFGIELNTLIFIITGAVFTCYAILDGFDLGAGTVNIFQSEQNRSVAFTAIGPVWVSNEVLLVISGGTLFAGFPKVYATALSAFYIPAILFLLLIILRGISIEFRTKEPMKWWRKMWSIIFSASSTLISFILGVLSGNVVWGIPIDENMVYMGGLSDIFNPYAILTGVMVVALFTLHSSIYLTIKTEDKMHKRLFAISNISSIVFTICYVLLAATTIFYLPRISDRFLNNPIFIVIPALILFLTINVTRLMKNKKFLWAFISTAMITLLLMITVAIGLYPDILISNIDTSYSLTIENSASSIKSLKILLLFFAIGAPLVVIYTVFLFRTFKGKVVSEDKDY